ncbi:site-specific integrase [Lawsonibacter sp. DFI.6.74]|nr:site-specific integrase [Lawsonibacter sp. DFI.6.74]MCG4773464.1 site-specific integrase [Lawsonibacter sp. DFI.5.51]
MKKKMQLTQREFDQFEDYLRHDEREESTIEAYLRSLTRFAEWADGRAVTKELAMEWKAALSEAGYRPISVNAMLAAVNKFFTCMGREDCKVKYLKLQRQMFRKSEKDLSKEEYQRLVQAAHEKGDLRMELILETICATGIRVGELKYITVEAVRAGVAEIALKGKIRTILLPHRLCRKLQKYAKQQKIASGKLFLTQDGLPVSRQSIWTRMKALCEAAGVERSKAFPHNLRSLFARSFYGSCHDVVRLADVLGHSSIETTRIYLMSTGKEYLRQLDKLGLVR